MEQDAAGDAEYREKHACGQAFPAGEQEAVENILLDDDPAETFGDVGGQRHDETVDQADADENFHDGEDQHDGGQPDGSRQETAGAGRSHYDAPSRGNRAMALPRSIAARSASDISFSCMCLTPSATF